jgi:ferrous iron transport protein A
LPPAAEIPVLHELLPLELLGRDAWADVAEVPEGHQWTSRLAELGLRAGCRLRVLQPGSPCLLQVGECRLCLRGEIAAQILVRPVAASA